MIKIQKNDFNLELELSKIKSAHSNIGAISTFIGYVRDTNNGKKIKSIKLEVYKEMAFKTLDELTLLANKKWGLIDSLIIHRFGKLNINEKIVLVAAFSKHRKESFEACNFMMDFLKKDAPFWKKEIYKDNFEWLQNIN